MGALIQTKGTQYLANFFNQRFTNPAVGGNLYDLRNLGGLESDFSKPFGVSSLFYLSEKYRGKWVDGSDVLYPTCSVTGVTSVVGHPDELTFPAGAFPMGNSGFYHQCDQRWLAYVVSLQRIPAYQYQPWYSRPSAGRKCKHNSVVSSCQQSRCSSRLAGLYQLQSSKSAEAVEVLSAK